MLYFFQNPQRIVVRQVIKPTVGSQIPEVLYASDELAVRWTEDFSLSETRRIRTQLGVVCKNWNVSPLTEFSKMTFQNRTSVTHCCGGRTIRFCEQHSRMHELIESFRICPNHKTRHSQSCVIRDRSGRSMHPFD